MNTWSSSAGIVAYALGLWYFWRSHVDLGPVWSITLELREDQQLVTHGVYRALRHPMYLGLLLCGVGDAHAGYASHSNRLLPGVW